MEPYAVLSDTVLCFSPLHHREIVPVPRSQSLTTQSLFNVHRELALLHTPKPAWLRDPSALTLRLHRSPSDRCCTCCVVSDQ